MKFYITSSLFLLGIIHVANAEVVTSGSRKTILSSSTISDSGEYFLGRDISGPITISVSDVVIDLNSFAIDGGANGIVSDGVNDITVKNGTIRNVSNDGITISNAQNIHLDNLLIDGGGSDGVSIITGTYLLIENCQIQRCGNNGLRLFDVTTARIENSVFDDHRNGIFAAAQINTQIINCVSSNNMFVGIAFSDTSRNSIACDIKSCKVFANNSDGISIISPAANPSVNFNIVDSIVEFNNEIGIGFIRTFSSVIQNCTVQKNMMDGITLLLTSDMTVLKCISNQNGLNGMSLSLSVNTCVKENITNANGAVGIEGAGTNDVFFLNKAQLNATNFAGVDLVAVYSIGGGGFTVGPATAFDNISVVV